LFQAFIDQSSMCLYCGSISCTCTIVEFLCIYLVILPIVKYGVERMNKEVSDWMRGSIQETDGREMPFIALRGFDSVVWSRLYSRELNPLEKQPWQVHCV
jgi:hypothetical protein